MDIITSIIYKQNQILLELISKKYNIKHEKLVQLFLTPTFYLVDISDMSKK